MANESQSDQSVELDLTHNPNYVQVVYKDGKCKGNGYIVGGHIVTVWHVVDSPDWMASHAGKTIDLPSFRKAGDKDLAYSRDEAGVEGLQAATAYDDGDEIVVKGFDSKGTPFSLKGTLDSLGPIFKDKMKVVLGQERSAEEGMSGSVVLNGKGEAVGVLICGRKFDEALIEPLQGVEYRGIKPWRRP